MNCPACGLDIDEMPAGREMDILVATKVMGYKLCSSDEAIALTNAAFPDRPGWGTWYIDDLYILEKPIPDTGLERLHFYSAEIAAAWKIGKYGWLWNFSEGWSKSRQAYGVECILIDAQKDRREYWAWASAKECNIKLTTETTPVYALARCRAALKAVGDAD